MLKKVVFCLSVLFLLATNTTVYGQDASVDVMANIGENRCIPNDKCEYFEDELGCQVDCSFEALQKQRETRLTAQTGENTDRNREINVPINNETSKPILPILSLVFIAVFFIFILLAYRWVHKEHKKPAEPRIQSKPIQIKNVKSTLKKPVYDKPPYLPQKPGRRLQ